MKNIFCLIGIFSIALLPTHAALPVTPSTWKGLRLETSFDGDTNNRSEVLKIRNLGNAIVMEERYNYLPEGQGSDRVYELITTTLSADGKITVTDQWEKTDLVVSRAEGTWRARGARIVATLNGKTFANTGFREALTLVFRNRRLSAKGVFTITSFDHFVIPPSNYTMKARQVR